MEVSRGRALSWRMGRQFLLHHGADTAEDVVARLGAVPAVSGDADLAVRRRLGDSTPGEVARALAQGRLLKTYAFRGATHLMAPATAGCYLALRAASRMWELPSWVEHYRVEPQRWPRLREIVRALVADGPITRERLTAGVTEHSEFSHLGDAFTSRSDTFLKPFAWQGDICFGPVEDGHTTFQSPSVSQWWRGVPDLDEAGRAAVAAYFDAYGPATPEHLRHWLGSGLSAGRKRITTWLTELADDLVDITVDGEAMLHARKHLDTLAEQPTSAAVILLPGYDQWVLGPGTADSRIVPSRRRATVTRGANLVLTGGVVTGTWKSNADTLAISWFAEAGEPPKAEVELEAERLSTLLGQHLAVAVTVV